MNKRRIKWIDIAKGICMLSVIAGHLGVKEINNVVFSFHLTVFFILSGYTLKKELLSSEYLNKKFKALMVPYFFTCISVACMDVINSIIINKKTSIKVITEILGKDFIRSFWASGTHTKFTSIDIGSRIGAIWFLPALFFAIIIIQKVLHFSDNKRVQYCIVISLAVLASISAKFIWFPFSIQSAMYASPFILLGYDFKQYNILDKLRWKHFFMCLLLFLIGIFTEKTEIYFVSASSPDLILSSIYGVCSSIVVIYLSMKIEHCRPLELIGQYSIYFLCIHLFELETMKKWYQKILIPLNLEGNLYILFIVKVVFIAGVTSCIVLIKKNNLLKKLLKFNTVSDMENNKRDTALDVAKGILIISMLIGHFPIDEKLLKIIYSFHMIAFVFYSGYCFNPVACKDIKKSIIRISKAFLIPYGLWGIAYIILKNKGFFVEARNVVAGVSFSRKVFKNCQSVGPVYFILLLFVVRVIYLFIEKYIKNDIAKHLTVLGISLLGFYLGEWKYWLPWSADCAMYAIIYYHLGYYFKKNNIMKLIGDRFYMYFLLSCFWVYMIFSGSMEIAIRKYGDYSITIIGSISASILLYMFAQYLVRNMESRLKKVLLLIGQNTIYILIFHTLFNRKVNSLVGIAFGQGYIYHMTISIVVQIIAGTLLGILINIISKKMNINMSLFNKKGA